MTIVWLVLGVVIGIFSGAFLLVQSAIVAFFGIPFAMKLRRRGLLLSEVPIHRYLGSLVVLLAVFAGMTWAVLHWLPVHWGYWCGLVLVLIPGLKRCGPTKENVSDFLQMNAKFIAQNTELSSQAQITEECGESSETNGNAKLKHYVEMLRPTESRQDRKEADYPLSGTALLMSHFSFSDGTGTKDDPIVIEPVNSEKVMAALKGPLADMLSAELPADAPESFRFSFARGFVLKLLKDGFFAKRFGLMNKDWKNGNHMLLDNNVEMQTVELPDGSSETFFFDFSTLASETVGCN